MAGTKAGGQAAAKTNKAKYGDDFYAKIGAKGGRLGKTGGFAANRELARIAGAKGGKLSRRGKSLYPLCSNGHAMKPENILRVGASVACLRCNDAAVAKFRQRDVMHFSMYDSEVEAA